jgi:hypothetical protein
VADLLAIYLNDHYAGSTAGLELARRTRASNEGTELGDFLERLTLEIEEDRQALELIMDRLGVRRDPLKQGFGWAAEKVGRLKLNGQLRGYSPLSRLLELEGLHLGISTKLSLWEILSSTHAAELDQLHLDDLIERARRQLDGLKPFRLEAARTALVAATTAPGR